MQVDARLVRVVGLAERVSRLHYQLATGHVQLANVWPQTELAACLVYLEQRASGSVGLVGVVGIVSVSVPVSIATWSSNNRVANCVVQIKIVRLNQTNGVRFEPRFSQMECVLWLRELFDMIQLNSIQGR